MDRPGELEELFLERLVSTSQGGELVGLRGGALLERRQALADRLIGRRGRVLPVPQRADQVPNNQKRDQEQRGPKRSVWTENIESLDQWY